jgi:hypothetical protein
LKDWYFSLETMAMALHQLNQHRALDNRAEPLLLRCIEECQRRTKEIAGVVNKMDQRLTPHARVKGRLYAAFKGDDVKDMMRDLETAKSSLEFAYTFYMAEEQKRRHDVQVEMLRQHQAMFQAFQAQLTSKPTFGSQNRAQLPSAEEAMQAKLGSAIS